MRMRFKPYAHDELMAADFHVHEPLIWGGRWHAQYARPEQPFVLELGCGKGGFISQLACGLSYMVSGYHSLYSSQGFRTSKLFSEFLQPKEEK